MKYTQETNQLCLKACKLITTKENNKLQVIHDNIFFISTQRFTVQIKMTPVNFEGKILFPRL